MPTVVNENNLRDGLQQEFVSIVSNRSARGQRVHSPLETRILELLESHIRFRGKTRFIRCRVDGKRLRLDGCLPSFFLKQLMQEALRSVPGIEEIDNRVVVDPALEHVFSSDMRTQTKEGVGGDQVSMVLPR